MLVALPVDDVGDDLFVERTVGYPEHLAEQLAGKLGRFGTEEELPRLPVNDHQR